MVVLAAAMPVSLPGQEREDPEGRVPDSVKTQKGGKQEAPVTYVPKGAELGKTVSCPVDRRSLTVRADTPAVTCRGSVVFFDTKACEALFRQNPEKYLPAVKKP